MLYSNPNEESGEIRDFEEIDYNLFPVKESMPLINEKPKIFMISKDSYDIIGIFFSEEDKKELTIGIQIFINHFNKDECDLEQCWDASVVVAKEQSPDLFTNELERTLFDQKEKFLRIHSELYSDPINCLDIVKEYKLVKIGG